MARPENKPGTAPRRKEMRIQPKQLLYVRDVLLEQGRGTTEPEVIRTLVELGIQQLISAGVIDRRRGEVTWDDVPNPPAPDSKKRGG